MKITRRKAIATDFEHVEGVFEAEGEIFLKFRCFGASFNAISLESAIPATFLGITTVTPYDAELILTETKG
jgi:hypothetical protein